MQTRLAPADFPLAAEGATVFTALGRPVLSTPSSDLAADIARRLNATARLESSASAGEPQPA